MARTLDDARFAVLSWIRDSLNDVSPSGNAVMNTRGKAQPLQRLLIALSALMVLLRSDAMIHEFQQVGGVKTLAPLLIGGGGGRGGTAASLITPKKKKKKTKTDVPASPAKRSGGVGGEEESTAQSQALYMACFCLWVLSYNTGTHADFAVYKYKPVRLLVEVTRTSTREKVIRMALSTLLNLANGGSAGIAATAAAEAAATAAGGGESGVAAAAAAMAAVPGGAETSEQSRKFCQAMLLQGLLTDCHQMRDQHWTDGDIATSFEALEAVLGRNYQLLSSFEHYKKEVESGPLRWGPTHKERFWQENAKRFEQDNFYLIKVLLAKLRAAFTAPEAEESPEVGFWAPPLLFRLLLFRLLSTRLLLRIYERTHVMARTHARNGNSRTAHPHIRTSAHPHIRTSAHPHIPPTPSLISLSLSLSLSLPLRSTRKN